MSFIFFIHSVDFFFLVDYFHFEVKAILDWEVFIIALAHSSYFFSHASLGMMYEFL